MAHKSAGQSAGQSRVAQQPHDDTDGLEDNRDQVDEFTPPPPALSFIWLYVFNSINIFFLCFSYLSIFCMLM